MVELHPIIKKQIEKSVYNEDQESIKNELEKLIENVIELNYDDQDIIDVINHIHLPEEDEKDEH